MEAICQAEAMSFVVMPIVDKTVDGEMFLREQRCKPLMPGFWEST